MVIARILSDRKLIASFGNNDELPANYGDHLDERVVEFPWIFARLEHGDGRLLDAGSALNFSYLMDHGVMVQKRIVIYTLSPEGVIKRPNISYVYGDLRHTFFQDESFDEIVCISTLEHIGMNNTMLYSADAHFEENRPEDYLQVIHEFRRLLKTGGKLLVTVPYGCYENHGWLQQFDRTMVEAVLHSFDGSTFEVAYYRYGSMGWQISSANDCSDCAYFDIHHRQGYEPDYVAAARAVACIEMIK
ncbi:MAG: methyltransferase domain-containing protein [Rectinemataceae bacterium]|nr:methyltransferase domain-containing protein [Rectinemataceae bacterium]